jgi:subtilisin family serine protease
MVFSGRSTTTWSRFVALTLLLALVASLIPVAPSSAMLNSLDPEFPPVQDAPNKKIDPGVLDALAATGEADFFVWMTEKADLSPAAQLTTKLEKGKFVYHALRTTADLSQRDLRTQLDLQGIRYQSFYIANKILIHGGTQATALTLATRTDVAKITPNRQYQLPEPFIDAKAGQQIAAIEPNLTFIRADQVWGSGVDGAGTVLAGNDTGLQWDHPAIKAHYRGWNGATANHNYNWWDATGTYPLAPGDGHGHGTHTTGTMVGDDGGANKIGVAPGAKTIHCKNMDNGGNGNDTTFSTCFQWNLAPWDLAGNNPRPDLAPDAINNSWGYWNGNNPTFEDEVDALQAAGIVVEVSAGNEGPACTSLRSPGDHHQVMTTGSVSHASGALPGFISGFSSRGPSLLDPAVHFPDVMAPGENIRSSVPGSTYGGGWSGTSMAGPHVTALVGLMWAANPLLRGQVDQTYDLIRETAVPLTGQTGSNCGGDYTVGTNNDWGHGTIDALAAVDAAVAFGDAGTLTGLVVETNWTPIAGALIKMVGGGWTFFTSTNSSGGYTRQLPAGDYEVTISKYGYLTRVFSPVQIVKDTTTIQEAMLQPAPSVTLSGYVTDSQTGWPLYARIVIGGYPGAPIWTDPLTGHYQIDLVSSASYTLDVSAWVDGYLPVHRELGQIDAPRHEDIALDADISTCSTPGYSQSIQLITAEDFEANNGGYTVSGVTSWEHGAPTTGPGAAHSGVNVWATNLDGAYNNYENGSIVSPVIDLSGYAGQNLQVRWWEWLQAENVYDHATVDATKDGGATWLQLYSATGNAALTWSERTVTLGPNFAVAGFRLRFRFDSDVSVTYPGWYVDDVSLQTVGCNPPTEGGLIVGNVYDDNTGLGLDEAVVTNEDGFATVTGAGADPLGSGFYTLFSPPGSKSLTAAKERYATETIEVVVADGEVVRQDFVLRAGSPVALPESIEATLPMGQQVVQQLTLQNTGGAPFQYELRESAPRFAPVALPHVGMRTDPPPAPLQPKETLAATSADLVHAADSVPSTHLSGEPTNAGNVIQTWQPTTNPNSWGIAFLPNDTLWVGEGWGSGHTDEYQENGAATGVSHAYTWNPSSGPADFTYNINTGMVWVMAVGGSNCTYELNPTAGFTGQTICPSWSVSQRGLAYDPWSDTYFGGGWNGETIYRFTPDGAILEEVNVGLDIAGLAFNPDTQHLFVITSADPTVVVVLDVSANYQQIGWFNVPGFPSQGGAGLEIDCAGNLWAVDQVTNIVVQFESGESSSWCQGIRWLSANPISGTLAVDAQEIIDITFDASAPGVDQPGDYSAELNIETDTPYRRLTAPVKMTVIAPPTWGKIKGMVSSQGYCNENPVSLADARVSIHGSLGFSQTLTADANGGFAYWVDESESPLTINASKEGHEPQQVDAVMVGAGTTTTQDIPLRILQPCISVDPESFVETLRAGDVIVRTLTISNTGAAVGQFEIRELHHGVTPLTTSTSWQDRGQVYVEEEEKSALPSAVGEMPGGGGPDPFGYTYRDSRDPDGPPYRWVEIAPQAGGRGVELTALRGVDDGHFFPFDLPFTFPFYGADYSELALASNGTIYFENAYLGLGNAPIPSTNGYRVQRFIAHLWDDLVIDPGAVYYENFGSMLIFEFYQVSGHQSPGYGTWQVALFSNGAILLQYQDVVFGDSRDFGLSATVGIQSDVSKGLQYSYNAPALTGDLAICFAPPGITPDCSTDVPWLDESPVAGHVPPDGAALVDVIFDASTAQLGEHLASLSVRTTDPFVSPLRVPTTMIVEPAAGPELSIQPETGVYGHTAQSKIHFSGAQYQIAGSAFSLDFDQDCLAFDPSDGDEDGIPDAVQLTLPPGFGGSVLYDATDLDGELDFLVADTAPPLASLTDGVLATVRFLLTCEPPPNETVQASVRFSSEPKTSFSDIHSTSVPGTAHHGWIEILAGIRGDCNSDTRVDAADLVACALEIFDGDGSSWLDVVGGSYAGNPVGCDSNADHKMDVADMICTVLIIFNGPGSCGAGVAAASIAPAQLTIDDGAAASPSGEIDVPVRLETQGHALAAAAFALEIDHGRVQLDTADANQDGVIDAVTFATPPGVMTYAQVNATKGVLEVYAANADLPFTPLSDGLLLTIRLRTSGDSQLENQSPIMFFAQESAVSLSDLQGMSIPVVTEDARPVTSPATEPDASTLRYYLPMIAR